MLDDTHNLPAQMRRLSDIVAEYDAKAAAIDEACRAFGNAVNAAEAASCVGGTYGAPIFYRGAPSLDDRTMRNSLRVSAWKHVYEGLNIDKIAPAADRSRFEMEMKNPPEFTLDNIRATFGHYVANPRQHILRGLAEAFCKLDDAYKSHSKVKIGVQGLPKRIILSNVGGYGAYGTERLRDTVNALRLAAGLPVMEWRECSDWMDAAKREPAELQGVTLKRFSNGNGHLIFSPAMLRTINLALAEFYGDVLPDTPDETGRKPDPRASVPAKDLQFYPTPPAVASALLSDLWLKDGCAVLEPSCGDGRLLDALRDKNPRLRLTGVEIDPARAREAMAKGYPVKVANFLDVTPTPIFDYVVMNPPFYGKHYQKHVEHAKKFLKPGGQLAAVLPASARYDHGYVPEGRGWRSDGWSDLPPASFAASGTNIPTGIYRHTAAK